MTVADWAFRMESCSRVPTVFVTVPASDATTTITVALDTVPSNANIEAAKVVDGAPTPEQAKDIITHITTTITDYVMFTQILSGVEASPTAVEVTPTPAQISPKPVAMGQGPYYFTAHSGTTFWIGGNTPPAGISYSTSTAIITVLPVPSTSPALSEESTSYSTITLTRVSLVLNTVRRIKSIPEDLFAATPIEPTTIPTASSKPFNVLRSSGWNTSTTSIGLKVFESGAALLKGHHHQTGARENFTKSAGTSPALTASIQSSIAPASTSSNNMTKSLEARQFGATVFATIEGELVSWINTYAGPDPTASDPIAATSNVPIHEDVQSHSEL